MAAASGASVVTPVEMVQYHWPCCWVMKCFWGKVSYRAHLPNRLMRSGNGCSTQPGENGREDVFGLCGACPLGMQLFRLRCIEVCNPPTENMKCLAVWNVFFRNKMSPLGLMLVCSHAGITVMAFQGRCWGLFCSMHVQDVCVCVFGKQSNSGR